MGRRRWTFCRDEASAAGPHIVIISSSLSRAESRNLALFDEKHFACTRISSLTSTCMEKVPYLGETLTRWQVGSSTFLAIPEHGARLMHWHVTHGDGSLREVIHWPELKSIDGVVRARGGNLVLF